MRFVVCYGTRPEKIKLEPVFEHLEDAEWYFSGQSPDLTDRHEIAGVVVPPEWPNLPLGIMYAANEVTGLCIHDNPDCVVVQGDTATAFGCALGAWLAGVPVAHVEAGLRTYRDTPFPEEGFRQMIARIAKYHFCPSQAANDNLFIEIGQRKGVKIHVTGNTVNDTLKDHEPNILATLHRRENWGKPIFDALHVLDDYRAAVIKHPNWKQFMDKDPSSVFQNVEFMDPVDHETMKMEMLHADLIVTDSGGIQEECAWFRKPCLVYRTETERPELLGDTTTLCPTAADLETEIDKWLAGRYTYGTGNAGAEIARILNEI